RLTKKECDLLASNIIDVLSASIEMGGTTLRDFVGGDGKPGYFQQTLRVYGRNDLPCVQCGTIIKLIRLGQRSTFYCSQCQS
ncbi:MAG: zinc finger domain-containing protein, partial [Pseudomonadales bacterium]